MSDKIFSRNNVNADIFEIEAEEGCDESDMFNASIGDATMRHVDELGSDVVCYENFIRMADGNLFAVEPNLTYQDDNSFGLKSQKDFAKFFKDGKIPEKYQEMYKEAIQNETDKQEASEDVMDQRGLLVSYEDWEANPGLSTQSWDLPQTPKPHVRYVGNCSQMFYDEFPEGHPDAGFINNILHMVNREWDDVTPKFVYAICKRIAGADIRQDTAHYLTVMVRTIGETTRNPEEVAVETLKAIDKAWSIEYYKQARLDEWATDKISQYFHTLNQQFKAELEKGTSRLRIFQTIKSLGKQLFGKREPLLDQGIEGRFRKRHWNAYKQLKRSFAPPVLVNGINLNRAYRNELQKALGVDQRTAKRVIMLRPFENLEELRRTGLVKLEDVARQSPVVAEFLDRITVASGNARSKANLKLFTNLPAEFIKEQKTTKQNIPPEEWKKIWECYNNEKTRVMLALRS